MKKYLIVILVFLFVGCSSVQIKSDDGSFRNDLKSEYYEKGNYKNFVFANEPTLDPLFNVNIDEVVRSGLIAMYLSDVYYVAYIKLNKHGMIPNLNDDKLLVIFRRIYTSVSGMGFEIKIKEIIQAREQSQGMINYFVNYQEMFLDKKGKLIVRENVPKREAKEKETKWVNRFN